MKLNFKKLNDHLLFVPLGGAGEIGMNLNMYHLNGKWLIVDIGIGFADYHYPGVDVVVPNINFIIEKKKDIVGIVLTHAHEDHIGGVPYLWPDIQAPVYTNGFTGAVLRAKLKEYGLSGRVPINILKPNARVEIGPFDIEMVSVTHSILENNGIFIRTKEGNIFHTGDWKFDDTPILGESTDKERLKAIGQEGVLAMVGDSTNIFNVGRSGSEGDLEASLEKLICECKKGLVVVTTFASNVTRLHSIAKAAQKAGRKVVLAGRSLWRMYRAALECNYLNDLEEFLEDKAARDLPRDKVLVISTGCQGEVLASVNKLANDNHPCFRMIAGDTIIFSSKIIPGNDKKIYALFNLFCEKKVEVLTEKDHFVHVSGHPAQEEVAEMYSYIKPLIAVPVHGESIHIHYHAKFAKEQGCKHAVEVTNGDVLSISQDGAKKLGKVESGYVLIDGESLIAAESSIVKTRRRIRDNGAVFITIVSILKNKKFQISDVAIAAPGLLDSVEDKDFLSAFEDGIKNLGFEGAKSELESRIILFAKKFIKRELNKFPELVVHIF